MEVGRVREIRRGRYQEELAENEKTGKKPRKKGKEEEEEDSKEDGAKGERTRKKEETAK